MSVAAACIVCALMFVLSMALLEGWPLQYYQSSIPSRGKTATKSTGICGKLTNVNSTLTVTKQITPTKSKKKYKQKFSVLE